MPEQGHRSDHVITYLHNIDPNTLWISHISPSGKQVQLLLEVSPKHYTQWYTQCGDIVAISGYDGADTLRRQRYKYRSRADRHAGDQ